MRGMFYNCKSLKELNLSNFNTINVVSMRAMFWGCSSLKELNISNFKINEATYMFEGCSKELKKII